LRPHPGDDRNDQRQPADNRPPGEYDATGEVTVPRQRTREPSPAALLAAVKSSGRSSGGGEGRASRPLSWDCQRVRWAQAGVRAWWQASRHQGRAWWPTWVCLSVSVGRFGVTARRVLLAGHSAAGWCWGQLLCPAVQAMWRVACRAAWWCWRRIQPPLWDAGGWLVHTGPGVAGRALLRVLRWSPGALARLLRYAVAGLGWLGARLVRYSLAYPDYAGIVREARELDRPRRARAALVAWRRAATRRSTSAVVCLLAAWWGLWWLDATYGRIAMTAVLMMLVAGLAAVGRAVRPEPESDTGAQLGDPPGADEPYPIADAHTRTEAADCVRRALGAEAIALRAAGEARRTPWGWEVAVVLRAGIPATVVAKTGNLETHLDLPAGGLLVTPDRTRRARVVLRLAERDPFAGLGPPPVRGPVSITQRPIIGQRIDGTPLMVPLLGVHGVIIGSSGAGKSTTLRTLADAAAACGDALVWDLDPAGCGLDALGPGVARRERDPAGITDALADALALAQARPRMLAELGMGAAWIPSPARPAVMIVVDEYPRLPDKAKALAVALLRIGRKARVTLVLAATEATSDALGAAIADTTALRILHACRHTDVRLVLGPQMLADGWRPDRLHPATADDPGEAGRAYVTTAGNREPLISAIHPLDESDAYQRGAARAARGLPRIDPQSWAAARAAHHHTPRNPASPAQTTETGGGQLPASDGATSLHHVLAVLLVFGDQDRLWTEDLLARLAQHDPHTYGEWDAEALSAVLRGFGITPTQIWRHGRNRRGYLRADIARAVGDDDTPGTVS
jgi:DNA segregation ATPase FtsK/SpoIIIE, S-DNA-T family